jgi:beta-glucosidase
VLTGVVAPSGRLPITLPRSVGQVPVHTSYRAGGGRSMFFGDYTDLAIQGASTTDPVEVALTVRNTGAHAGDEVVQLYVRDDVASVVRPDQMLIGFARVTLAPGEARRVTFSVHPSRLAFYDPQMRFVAEPGAFTFSVGASSANIRVEQTITLSGAVAEYRQRAIVATQVEVG